MKAYKGGNPIAKDILESYAQAGFYQTSGYYEEIQVVTYIAAEDISTVYYPGNQAHSLGPGIAGKCLIPKKHKRKY